MSGGCLCHLMKNLVGLVGETRSDIFPLQLQVATVTDPAGVEPAH